MKVGIFGGSFDMVHNEHINLSENVINEFDLDKLIICPSFIPPHKIGQRLTEFSFRYEMLKLAFSENEKVEISDFENNNSTSYTYITIQHFKSLFTDSELFFLVGTDMLLDFPTWKNPEIILDNASLIVTSRGNEDLSVAIENYYKSFSKKLLISSFKASDLSSTKIKTYYKLGLDISGFTPSKVVDYIDQKALYKSNNYYNYVKNELPLKRRTHTANVIVCAKKLAKQLKVDQEKCELASLLHDVAKYKTANDFPEFALPKDIPCCVPEKVIHQFLGAYVSEKILKITDREVIDAIKYHTTGRANMGTVEKIVFIADLIEEGRNYNGVDEIRQKVFSDFEQGFKFATRKLVEFLSKDEEKIYPLTIECEKYYNG